MAKLVSFVELVKTFSKIERVLLVSIAVLVSVTISISIFLLINDDSRPLPSLGTYETPQCITNNVLNRSGICSEDGPLPSAYLGDLLNVIGRRCVNTEDDKPLNVLTWRTFTRVDNPDPTRPQVVPASTRQQELREPSTSCITSTFNIVMPPGMTPGIWRIDAVDLSSKDGLFKSWSTYNFEVLPPP